MTGVPYRLGANAVPIGALRTQYDHMVAEQFLAEAAHPPVRAVDHSMWRRRWLPWLSGRAPGPIGASLLCHAEQQVYWRGPGPAE